ncbi:unnamed protein product [Oikopleura dioica]|uniref:Uncharacterized protein n=1 Tax=Oikopleura dioica TaxID=34765 RepID=E4XIL3_OIKDI|nr:unnamed protein product [Oikopleura dioica]
MMKFNLCLSIKDRLRKWQDREQNSRGIQTEEPEEIYRMELAPQPDCSSNVEQALEATQLSGEEPSADQKKEACSEEVPEEQIAEDNEEIMRLQREKGSGSVLNRWPENEPADDGRGSQQTSSTDYTKRMVEIKDQDKSVSKITSSWESKNAGYLDDSSWMDRAKSLSESHHYEPDELLQNDPVDKSRDGFNHTDSSSSSSSSDSDQDELQEAESVYQEDRASSQGYSQQAESAFLAESPFLNVDESSTTSVNQLKSFFESCFSD